MSANLGSPWKLYAVIFGVAYASYGMGYIITVLLPPSLSQVCAVVVVFCLAAFDTASPTIPQLREALPPFNFQVGVSPDFRWGYGIEYVTYLTPALKSFYDNEQAGWKEIVDTANVDITRFSIDNLGMYPGDFDWNIWILVAWGVVLRLVAVAAMVLSDSNKKL